MLKNKKWILPFAFALCLAPLAQASTGGDGFAQVAAFFFGDENSRNNAASCNYAGATNPGILGQVNMIFCHLEKDLGITGAGQATKTFSNNGASTTVKCSITANAAGATYANTASCWVCTGASCSNFSRLLNLQWTYAAGGANTGVLIMDNGAFNGTVGSGEYVTWDTGASTTTKTVTAKVMFSNGGQTFKMGGTAKKNGSVRQVSMAMANGSNQFALEAAVDTSANLANAVFLSNAQGSCMSGFDSTSAANPDVSCAQCYARTASSTPGGDGFTYTAGSGCSALSLVALPNTPASVAAFTVGDSTANDVLNGAGAAGVTEWNGQAATPGF